MRLLSRHRHFEVQAAIVCGDDGVGETGADGEVGARQPAGQQPARADLAAGLLVLCDVQFHRAGQVVSLGHGVAQG